MSIAASVRLNGPVNASAHVTSAPIDREPNASAAASSAEASRIGSTRSVPNCRRTAVATARIRLAATRLATRSNATAASTAASPANPLERDPVQPRQQSRAQPGGSVRGLRAHLGVGRPGHILLVGQPSRVRVVGEQVALVDEVEQRGLAVVVRRRARIPLRVEHQFECYLPLPTETRTTWAL